MKKVVAFLLALIIFVAPVTTLVKADVVIGDNDDIVINENATILGRKLALMESLSDLALSGVTEFNISHTSDVDSYLDYLWSEVGDALDYLDSGEWTNDLTNELASKYFTNLVQYQDYINNRGDYFAYLLGHPTTSLLSTFFANNIFGKHSTLHNNLSLDTFRSLSALNHRVTPQPDVYYTSYINKMNGHNDRQFTWYNMPSSVVGVGVRAYPATDYTWYSHPAGFGSLQNISYGANGQSANYISCTNLTSLYINQVNNIYVGSIVLNDVLFTNTYYNCSFDMSLDGNGQYFVSRIYQKSNVQLFNNQTFTYQGTLEQVFNYFSDKIRNVNIYVDGNPWAIVGQPQNPTLDIDGILKLFGNDSPQQYTLQPNTSIDYDQLYQVIFNAIRDNLPISQGDINYYDSHDTIYSPTIINNYGEEEGDESDIIDTILDYAVIPKFDTAIAQPMRTALINGVVIMQNSITNVIPDEILLVIEFCIITTPLIRAVLIGCAIAVSNLGITA